jgi:hypothetical protein
MARRIPPIVSSTGGLPHGGELPHVLTSGFDRVLAVHRPVVLAHLRDIRRRSPQATNTEIVGILERRYLAAVTSGGALVGVAAVVPGIGTGVTLALSGAETLGFLETTALFTQSVSEVHGLAITDPQRARALVMTLMLGSEGSELVRQLAGQASGSSVSRSAFWGELVTTRIPRAVMGPLAGQLRRAFMKKYAAQGSASILGKAMPFGIGAVVGGVGNNILGRRVVHSARMAFGPLSH